MSFINNFYSLPSIPCEKRLELIKGDKNNELKCNGLNPNNTYKTLYPEYENHMSAFNSKQNKVVSKDKIGQKLSEDKKKIKECAEKCINNKNCKYFTQENESNKCLFYKESNMKENLTKFKKLKNKYKINNFLKQSITPGSPDDYNQKKYYFVNNGAKVFPNSDKYYKEKKDYSEDECKSICLSDSNCNSMTFLEGEKTCKYYSSSVKNILNYTTEQPVNINSDIYEKKDIKKIFNPPKYMKNYYKNYKKDGKIGDSFCEYIEDSNKCETSYVVGPNGIKKEPKFNKNNKRDFIPPNKIELPTDYVEKKKLKGFLRINNNLRFVNNNNNSNKKKENCCDNKIAANNGKIYYNFNNLGLPANFDVNTNPPNFNTVFSKKYNAYYNLKPENISKLNNSPGKYAFKTSDECNNWCSKNKDCTGLSVSNDIKGNAICNYYDDEPNSLNNNLKYKSYTKTYIKGYPNNIRHPNENEINKSYINSIKPDYNIIESFTNQIPSKKLILQNSSTPIINIFVFNGFLFGINNSTNRLFQYLQNEDKWIEWTLWNNKSCCVIDASGNAIENKLYGINEDNQLCEFRSVTKKNKKLKTLNIFGTNSKYNFEKNEMKWNIVTESKRIISIAYLNKGVYAIDKNDYQVYIWLTENKNWISLGLLDKFNFICIINNKLYGINRNNNIISISKPSYNIPGIEFVGVFMDNDNRAMNNKIMDSTNIYSGLKNALNFNYKYIGLQNLQNNKCEFFGTNLPNSYSKYGELPISYNNNTYNNKYNFGVINKNTNLVIGTKMANAVYKITNKRKAKNFFKNNSKIRMNDYIRREFTNINDAKSIAMYFNDFYATKSDNFLYKLGYELGNCPNSKIKKIDIAGTNCPYSTFNYKKGNNKDCIKTKLGCCPGTTIQKRIICDCSNDTCSKDLCKLYAGKITNCAIDSDNIGDPNSNYDQTNSCTSDAQCDENYFCYNNFCSKRDPNFYNTLNYPKDKKPKKNSANSLVNMVDNDYYLENNLDINSEDSCPDTIQTVCGTDNKSYRNACYAKLNGVNIQYPSNCNHNDIHDSNYINALDEQLSTKSVNILKKNITESFSNKKKRRNKKKIAFLIGIVLLLVIFIIIMYMTRQN